MVMKKMEVKKEEGCLMIKGSSALLRLAIASPVFNNDPRTSKHFNIHGKPKWHLFSLWPLCQQDSLLRW